MQALILAAGQGTRMRSERPKVLHEILGRPMLAYGLDTVAALGVKKPVVVLGAQFEQARSFLKEWNRAKSRPMPAVIHQKEQRGTGHAVRTAEKIFRNRPAEDILIWPADMPLVKSSTLEAFVGDHERSRADVSVLSSSVANPCGYGRILRREGNFYAIREELDATEAEREIQEVNTGIYLFKSGLLFEALRKIRPQNAKKEFYLTDTIEILFREGRRLEAFRRAVWEEAQGINSRAQLAEAIQLTQQREIERHQKQGVTIISPAQTFIEPDTEVGVDTVIYPWCYIESGVQIGRRCQIGPFAKIRKGSVIGDDTVIGSFVEVTRSRIGKKVLAKHLAYLGDAVVGDETNVGAGTITANFDGVRKHQTRIGKKVLIGSNTVFVAPVTVGDQAKTGAGSVILAGSKIKRGSVVAGVPARSLPKKKKKGS